MDKIGDHPFVPQQRAFEALVLLSYPGRKIIKKYIVIATAIPKNMADLNLSSDYGELLEAKQLNHEVVVNDR